MSAVLDTYGITGEAANERGLYAIPLLRLNSIAVLAFSDNAFEAVSYWLNLLDVPPDEDSARAVRVYNVQNAKSADLATVLNELYGGGEGAAGGGRGQAGQAGFGGLFGRASGGRLASGGRRGGGRAAAAAGRLGGASQANQGGGGRGGRNSGGGGGFGGGRGGARPAGVLGGQPGRGLGGGGPGSVILAGGTGPLAFFKEEVRIVADEVSNSLVILATKQDYEEIRKVLRDLDVVPRQVVIEVLIAEISLNKGMDMGLQSVIANSGAVGSVPSPPAPTESADGVAGMLGAVSQAAGVNDDMLKRLWNVADNGALTAIITDQSSFRFTLTALATAGRLKVLASPHILTADNREASINIGQSIPIITSTQQSTLATANVLNSVQYRDTGVILNILPQVNADGLVNLQIRQEVSQVGTESFGSSGSPSFITREAETTAVVQDGDSLLIGGIIQENTRRVRSGIPYLMDIPVLGRLFRFDQDDVERVELIILLTPQVVRNRAEALEVTQGYKDRLWDVVDEIERTKGLQLPTKQQLGAVERLRSRTTTAEKPRGLLPNRAWED